MNNFSINYQIMAFLNSLNSSTLGVLQCQSIYSGVGLCGVTILCDLHSQKPRPFPLS